MLERQASGHVKCKEKGMERGKICIAGALMPQTGPTYSWQALVCWCFWGAPWYSIVSRGVGEETRNTTHRLRHCGNTGKHVEWFRYTSSTAQGGGGSFKNRKPIGKVGCCESRMAEWQSESTDGPTGGWRCVFWNGCNGCSGHLTTTAGCSVV